LKPTTVLEVGFYFEEEKEKDKEKEKEKERERNKRGTENHTSMAIMQTRGRKTLLYSHSFANT